MRIGILTSPGKGHANPLCAIGGELAARGHAVTVISAPDAGPVAKAAGLNFVAVASSAFPSGRVIERRYGVEKLTGLEANEAFAKVFAVLCKAFFEEAVPVIHDLGLEFLIADQLFPIGRTVVDIVELPFVTICPSAIVNPSLEVPSFLSPFEYRAGLLGKLLNLWSYIWYLQGQTSTVIEAVNECRKKAGLHTVLLPLNADEYINSPIATIVPMPRSLEFPRSDLSEHTHFVGTLESSKARPDVPFPWDRLKDDFIYASFGTHNISREILPQVAEACERLNRQAVISLGGHKQSLSFPDSSIVVDYAPQLELLGKAALCVTHAGVNTTIESLTRGIPLLAIPLVNDEPGISSRIKHAGVGDRVLPKELSVPLLAERIEKVLNDPTYKANAVKMAGEIARAGGVKRAADVIEQAMTTNQPVPYWWKKDLEAAAVNG